MTTGESSSRVVLTCLVLLSGALGHAVGVQTDAQAMMYLSQFGYLSPSMKNPNSGHIMSEETMARALMDFQSFAGLNLTGHLDDDTLHYMSMPRCGVRDKVGFATDSRSRRYALQGSRWRVKDLTYKISKYPKLIDKSETDAEVRKAFDVWSDVTPLTFTHKKSGQVHIEIRFEKGEHGDGDPFDGPGGTLAHAFFPVYGGDAHFDDSEKWSIGSYKGTNLFQVAAHEFGHSLGLSHSDVRSALMAPFYRGYNPDFTLDSDDIEAIQALYGSGSSGPADNDDDSTSQGSGKKTTTQEPPGTEGSDAELCTDTKVNALFNSADGETFVLKGDYYWKLTDDGLAQGYPKPISGTWSGLPGNVDAAFTYKNGKTYFFKDKKYWRYTGTTMDDGYPKVIADGFAGIPDNVDAALVWSGNGKIYFFKGTKFWKFDPTQKPPVMNTYPKPISNWDGIPDNIDTALHYTNGYTYFFKDGNYYRFNDRTFAVDTADPPFPRNAGYWWFGCRAENKGHSGKDATVAASELKPTWSDVKRDHKGNQNTDVGDMIMDADGSRQFNETLRMLPRSSSPKHTSTIKIWCFFILTSLRRHIF